MISSIFLVMALQQQAPDSSVQSVTTGRDGAAAARQRVHRVVAGETLSSIAPAMGESWPQLYAGNESVIGTDPNLIYAGEMLHAGPGTRPAAVHTGSSPSAVPGRAWDVSYGYPNYCGDGDGDGWDVPCQVRAARPAAPASLTAAPARPVAYTGSGTYSYGALESLWESAGGPAWAAPHAAEIAECESSGNPRAYNPSGATGLFQILGSVVPGNLYDPFVNALNAVSKFRASGDTFAQWVCT